MAEDVSFTSDLGSRFLMISELFGETILRRDFAIVVIGSPFVGTRMLFAVIEYMPCSLHESVFRRRLC